MAISKEVWAKAKFLFELGSSLGDIEKETEIDRSSISKKSKKENWEKAKNQQLKSEIVDFEIENSTLQDKKSTLVEKVASLNDFEITMFENIIEDEVKHKSLIFSTQSLALVRNNQILTKNSKTVMLKVVQYDSEGRKQSEDYEPYDVALSSSDVKEIVDSTDKASITLGVSQRHAPKSDVNLTNATQVNDNKLTIEFK